ncbi:hypothetical protein CH275_05200 [Rhodococcus sp. 06-235-1A]|nr:hypothetical protein CH275_05200 [Rhodococcus sp. 06-235-1A]
MHRVAIIHPWMPQYRLRFFERLQKTLKEIDIELDIFYGETPLEWRARNDSFTPTFAQQLPTRYIKVGGRHLIFKSVRTILERHYDLIILEQAIRNLETYALLLHPKTKRKIAYWGHGQTFTVHKKSSEEALKTRLTKNSVWFFGYTQAGVDAVVASGYPQPKTTVVQNSIDTAALKRDLASVTDTQIQRFSNLHGLTRGLTGIYIGGLDAAKRIGTLLETAQLIHSKVPNFRLIIAGDGDQAGMVGDWARDHQWAVTLGPIFGSEKALALRSADFMLNPGRVGLTAVDSLTSGLPMLTTNWPFHAPEFSYLTNGDTAVVSDDNPTSLADEAAALMAAPEELARMSAACVRDSAQYTTEAMVMRFVHGIQGALKTKT